MRVIKVLSLASLAIFVACSSSSNVKKAEYVELLLVDGAHIKARVLEIDNTRVVIDAKNWKDAYEHGESILREQIKGVKLSDGMILTLDEYEASRKGVAQEKKNRKPEKKAVPVSQGQAVAADFQYEQLKAKPISEMSENEFKFFMAMKEKEWQEEAAKSELDTRAEELERAYEKALTAQKTETPAAKPKPEPRTKSRQELERSVESMLDAGLAPTYMLYLDKKARAGVTLDETEAQMKDLIERNPKWQETLEELEYLNRSAEKALSRAYLYDPEELQTKLKLQFDPDADMDYHDLLSQLHLAMGEDVKMHDYRKLVDVLGDSGGRAVKELLENYSNMKLLRLDESVFLAH